MKRYRRKEIVTVIQWDGSNQARRALETKLGKTKITKYDGREYLEVRGHGHVLLASLQRGDWIVWNKSGMWQRWHDYAFQETFEVSE